MVAEPGEETEPARLVEFHGYRDPRLVSKVMLRCALYRLQLPAPPLRCHIIHLDHELESARVDDGGLFQPAVHDLPDLSRQVTIIPCRSGRNRQDVLVIPISPGTSAQAA